MHCSHSLVSCFFFDETASSDIYTLSLHDALPISRQRRRCLVARRSCRLQTRAWRNGRPWRTRRKRRTESGSRPAWSLERSEEHTSELQSRQYLVCRLLLEKKKTHDKCNYRGRPHI